MPFEFKSTWFYSLWRLPLSNIALMYIKPVFSMPDKLMEAELSQKLGKFFK